MMVTSHLSRLQDVMKKVGFDAVLVTSELNQRYLSGFNYTDGYVLVLQGKAYLITDFRYIDLTRSGKPSGNCPSRWSPARRARSLRSGCARTRAKLRS